MKKYDLVIENGGTICYNRKASTLTAVKTGGVLDTLLIPNNADSMAYALQCTDSDRLVLGNFTNTLISDKGLHREVIATSKCKGIIQDDNRLICSLGESLSAIAIYAKKNSLSGLERLSGIPGSIAGAVVMNAGAYGDYIADIVSSVEVWCDGKIYVLTNKELDFGYRTSRFNHTNEVILSVTLELAKTNQLLINKVMKDVKTKRQNSQPTESSLGSVFKRYLDNGAGYYIENCGLKGWQIGGCSISDKHANFIINNGGGTSQDYMDLMCLAENKVKEKYGIILEREVRVFGEFERKVQDNC